ncbi:EamA-like transporter family protein [Parelusimicrobium proximum]|uniref:DMT family transporter n=1 Tax=Parelusimicrobium proximum TaxID=3228953 RepID=UPI003D162924
MTKNKALAALWSSWFITALTPVVGAYVLAYVTPILFVAVSCALAVLFMTPVLIKKGILKDLFNPKYIPSYLVIGTFSTALPMSIMMFSLNYTTPANMAILNQTELLFSLIFAYILLKERPSAQQLGGSALVLLGTALILATDAFSIKWKGDLMVIGCVWMFQLGHVAAKKLPANIDYTLIVAARALYALPVLIIMTAFLWFKGGLVFQPNTALLLGLIFSGFLNYALGNMFWYMAIRNMDLGKATAIILSYPVMTFILSVLFGIEKGHLYQVAGLALAFTGAYWITHIVKKQGERA